MSMSNFLVVWLHTHDMGQINHKRLPSTWMPSLSDLTEPDRLLAVPLPPREVAEAVKRHDYFRAATVQAADEAGAQAAVLAAIEPRPAALDWLDVTDYGDQDPLQHCGCGCGRLRHEAAR
jgi:hypothetical protein